MADKPDKPMNIYQKLLEVRKSVPFLKKDNAGHQYKYVSSSQTILALRSKLDELGLMLFTEVADSRMTLREVENKGKTSLNVITELDIRFTWVNSDNPDETIVLTYYGQGIDLAGEKGVGKALTYAEKYFFLKQFNIPTDKDDPDTHQTPPATPEKKPEFNSRSRDRSRERKPAGDSRSRSRSREASPASPSRKSANTRSRKRDDGNTSRSRSERSKVSDEDKDKQKELWAGIQTYAMTNHPDEDGVAESVLETCSSYTSTKTGEYVQGVRDVGKLTGRWLNMATHNFHELLRKEGHKVEGGKGAPPPAPDDELPF